MKNIKLTILAIALVLLVLPVCAIFAGCGIKDGIVVKEDAIRTSYELGEELEITGGLIEFTEEGKTIQVAITEDMVSNFSTQKLGIREMVITYKGFTTTLAYIVNPLSLDTSKGYSITYDGYIYSWFKFNSDMTKVWFANISNSVEPSESDYKIESNLTKSIQGNKYVLSGELELVKNSYICFEIVVNDAETFDLYEWEKGSEKAKDGSTYFKGIAPIDINGGYYIAEHDGYYDWLQFADCNSTLYIELNRSDDTNGPTKFSYSTKLTRTIVDGKIVYSGRLESTNYNLEIKNITSTGFDVLQWQEGSDKSSGKSTTYENQDYYLRNK